MRMTIDTIEISLSEKKDIHPVYLGVSFVPLQPRKKLFAFLKRAIDVLGAALGLVILAPVFAAIALSIKLSSAGPIFFSQIRVTAGGKHFRIVKFRTMVPDAERLKEELQSKNEAAGPVFKMKNDPRITRIGRFLRKTSLDELPQLINVLKGDMSIVGPRPPLPSEVARYEPWQLRRLSVLPGLTCTWQVSGRSNISFEQWMKMDIEYIETWSLRQDFRIILATCLVVITGKGAYCVPSHRNGPSFR